MWKFSGRGPAVPQQSDGGDGRKERPTRARERSEHRPARLPPGPRPQQRWEDQAQQSRARAPAWAGQRGPGPGLSRDEAQLASDELRSRKKSRRAGTLGPGGARGMETTAGSWACEQGARGTPPPPPAQPGSAHLRRVDDGHDHVQELPAPQGLIWELGRRGRHVRGCSRAGQGPYDPRQEQAGGAPPAGSRTPPLRGCSVATGSQAFSPWPNQLACPRAHAVGPPLLVWGPQGAWWSALWEATEPRRAHVSVQKRV